MASRDGGSTVINININEDGGIFDLLGNGLQSVELTVPLKKTVIEVDEGQGLAFNSTGQVVVNAGAGLGFDTTDKLVVDAGTGLTLESGSLAVDVAGLAGPGITVNSNGQFTTGGTTVAGAGLAAAPSGVLSVDSTQLAGPGLGVTPGTTNLIVVPGDGVVIDSVGRVAVNAPAVAAQIAGPGLVLNKDMGQVAVDTSVTSTVVFNLLTDVNIGITPSEYSSTLNLNKTVTQFTVQYNSGGAVVGFVQGASTVTTDPVVIPDGYGYGSMLAVPGRSGSADLPNFYNKG